MRILVIGGTRFIGAAAVRRLHQLGHTLAVFNRGQSPLAPPEGVTRLTGDIAHLDEAREAFAAFRPDVALHTIAITRQHAFDFMAAVRGLAGRVVLLSSMDVYRAYGRLIGTEPGSPDPVPLNEDSPRRSKLYPYRDKFPEGHIMRDYDKIPIEKVVMGEPGLPGTVLRLPMVIGPHDYQHRLYPFIKPMLDGRPHLVMQAEYARWRSTFGYVENIGAGIARACLDERAAGHVYNVGVAAFSMLELGQMVKAALDWPGEFKLIPGEALPPALRVDDMNLEQPLVCSTSRIRWSWATARWCPSSKACGPRSPGSATTRPIRCRRASSTTPPRTPPWPRMKAGAEIGPGRGVWPPSNSTQILRIERMDTVFI